MDNDVTIREVLEELSDRKAKLDDKLDKTVNKINGEINMLEAEIRLVTTLRDQNIGKVS